MGFHIPPINSVDHLHLHVQGLPYKSIIRKASYPVVPGCDFHHKGFNKGFSWFVEVGQAIQILEQGGRVGPPELLLSS
jgi:sulfate adenylyltransferase (ADP) / adenylylsulfatase